jgi:hypothetical protein
MNVVSSQIDYNLHPQDLSLSILDSYTRPKYTNVLNHQIHKVLICSFNILATIGISIPTNSSI